MRKYYKLAAWSQASLAPHERLPELPIISHEKPHTGATARENPRDATVIARLGTSFPAWPGEQSLVFSPNFTGGFTPFRPLNGLQEIPVATWEDSRVLCFPSRRGLTSGESGMQPRDPCCPWRGTLCPGQKPRPLSLSSHFSSLRISKNLDPLASDKPCQQPISWSHNFIHWKS